MQHPLCACGCGLPTELSKRFRGSYNRFITGHNKGNRRPPAQFTCLHCLRVVDTIPSEAKNRKFCSHSCRDSYRQTHTGQEHYSYNRIEVPCAECGKMVMSPPNRTKKPVYCSKECGSKAKSHKLSQRQTKAGSWHNGVTIAMNRDNGRCRICGYDEIVHVHHIRRRADGGQHTLDNLITLCPNCHAKAHRGMISVETMSEVVRIRNILSDIAS